MSSLELDGYLTGVIVTPKAAPVRPSAWICRRCGDDEPIFEDDAQIDAAFHECLLEKNRQSCPHAVDLFRLVQLDTHSQDTA
jgi:hypothetical protein